MKKVLYLSMVVLGIWGILQLVPVQITESKEVLESKQFRIAHRCGRNIFPENTIYSCSQIIEENLADFLEIDFHLTKDGIPVVIHDDTLDRTTNGRGLISTKTWDEIKDLDAGYNFSLDDGVTFPYRNKGVRLDNLEKFIQEFKNEKLMIEVKPNSYRAADILLNLIEQYGIQERVIIGSFHQNIKDYMKTKNPNLAYFASQNEVILWVLLEKVGLSHLYKLQSHTMALPPKKSILTLNQALIQKLKSHNLKVFVWTINDKNEIEYWKSIGIDGVMTDDPRLFNSISN